MRSVIHPKMLRTVGEGLRQLPATITDPGAMSLDDDGGQLAGTPRTIAVPAYVGEVSYQQAAAAFGHETAAYVRRVAYLPAGTEVREGWTITLEGFSYTVAMPHQSVAPGAPVHCGLVSRETVPGITRGEGAL